MQVLPPEMQNFLDNRNNRGQYTQTPNSAPRALGKVPHAALDPSAQIAADLGVRERHTRSG